MTSLASNSIRAGAPLDAARAAVVLVHGRGATAEGMLELAEAFDSPDLAYVAPQATGGSWYPHSFMAPITKNEPHLGAALGTLADIVADLEHQGIAADRTVLLGFSQGACLALEFAARNARRYGGVVGLSGGLIGPAGTPRSYAGSLAGTPIFLGCSDADFHIPLARVHETADVFGKLGADVVEQIYPGMGHTIIQDEIDRIDKILRGIGKPANR
ncbi:alpha/beta hydrolase [Hyphomicrobium sp.]|jgi:phospholipase/carboxylesterase|uniref:alpha/beta hydrolase n=1 Tax=Hyphomicrobium sp. TaxID=82 RepID=UPI002CCE5F4E|nr:dienelactone hydrolase family protein [Hyphomicrobium sp.]HVZ06224.1 dienelactone hydrolase family protein [Hyphomicrobium sp.]